MDKGSMRFVKYQTREPNMKAWMWKLSLGPASILDGFVETLSFGCYGLGARLAAARRLAMARSPKCCQP